MTLICQADFLRDQGERPIGPAHPDQSLGNWLGAVNSVYPYANRASRVWR